MKIITQLDMYRNSANPMVGNKTNNWDVGGACFTAQTIPFHADALDGLVVESAIWRICWKPNINSPAQTAVRLCWANSGPSNITQIESFFSGGKTNTPLNEAVNITEKLNQIIFEHKNPATYFQLFTHSIGDGTNAPLIYSSALEITYDILA